MKRIFLSVILSLVLLLFVAVYAFFPKKLIISSASSFKANREGVFRCLIDENNWQKWWPGTISKNSQGSFLFRYKGYDFQIDKILYNIIQLKLGKNNDSSLSSLKVVPFAVDSIGVELSSELDIQSDPFSRVSGYFHAKKLKHALDDIVLSLKKYTRDLKNIYGINIKNEKVEYQNLVSAKQSFSHYPTTEDVYTIIGKLRNYINKSGGRELFSPMLNIQRADSVTYTAQVGIPIDKKLPPKDNITLKWMMKGGNILTSEVRGGQQQIDEAARQMERYINDYQRSIIAIPFQMLITDRTKQPDSTKWITRIYYPVI